MVANWPNQEKIDSTISTLTPTSETTAVKLDRLWTFLVKREMTQGMALLRGRDVVILG